MQKSTFLTNLILSLFGILIGITFFFINSETLLRLIFILVGLYVVFLSIPGFITFSSIAEKKERNITLISSIIIASVGLALIIYPHMVVELIAGVFFIFLPIYRIIVSQDKKDTFKKELVKICLGVILILCGFGSVFQVLLYIIGWLAILLSLLYMIYNIIIYIKINKAYKKNKQENDVIDV